MPFLSQSQINALTSTFNNLTSPHPKADFYLQLAQFMDDAWPYPDSPPSEYRAAILWLRGAAEVNAGSGSQSDFIRGYNKAQYEARTGLTLSDAEMDAVSDAVAAQVFGQVVNDPDHKFPTINVLAEKDAEPAAGTIFEGNMGGWAGNHLFLLLGYSDAFYNNVVESDSSTYDAVAMIKFTDEAFSTANWFDGIVQTLAYPSGAFTYLAGMSTLDAFLSAAYACVPQSTYMDGGRNFIRSFDSITLGRTFEGDVLFGTEDRNFIHGGGGNDTIFGSLGADILDGAEGRDVVDYSNFEGDRLFTLTGAAQSTADYVGYVTGTGASDVLQASLFGIEQIVAGAGDDEFRIESLPGTLERIDGGGQGEKGDTLDLSDLTSNTGAVIVLQGEEGGAGYVRVDLSQIAVDSFENVIGSGKNDSIKGSAEANVIQGDGGDDTIDGGGGVDLLAGGSGADTFDVDLSGASGPVIVWGGAGADTISITTNGESQLGIMMVNVTDLTEANFHQLSLDALGMPEDFDWSKIGAIVVNAESDDDIKYNGQSLRGHEETVSVQHNTGYGVRENNPDPRELAWGDAFKAAGFEVVSEEAITISEDNPDMDGTYLMTELSFQAKTSESYIAVGNLEEGPFWEVNRVQGAFLSGSQDFYILSSSVGRSVIMGEEASGDITTNSLYRTLPVDPFFIIQDINFNYTPPYEGSEPEQVTIKMKFYFSGYLAFPDGWDAPQGGIVIPPDPDYDFAGDYTFGYMTSEEIVFNTAETIGEWYIVGGKMEDNGGIVSDGTITVSLGEEPVAAAADRFDFV